MGRTVLLGAYPAKQCAVRLQNDICPPPGTVAAPVSMATERRFELGRVFETAVLDELERRVPGAVRIGGRDEEAAARTLAAMRSGAAVILAAVLPADAPGHRTGAPDVLIRHGDGYLPADVKSHGLAKPRAGSTALASTLTDPRWSSASPQPDRQLGDHLRADAFQIAHYWRMLQGLGLAASSSPRGAIIDTAELVWWIDLEDPASRVDWSSEPVSWLDDYDHEFAFRVDVAERAHAQAAQRRVQQTLQPMLLPSRIGECGTCPWHDPCLADLRARDHVSLLPDIRARAVRLLEDNGFTTRRSVAELDPLTASLCAETGSGAMTAAMHRKVEDAPPATALGDVLRNRDALVRRLAASGIRTTGQLLGRIDPQTWALRGQKVGDLPRLIDCARAATAGTPYRARGVESLDLPTAVVEVDLDMECDEQGFTYLWGALPTVDGVPGDYVAFDSYDPAKPEAEADILLRLLDWLRMLRQRAHELAGELRVYHWTGAELSAVRRISDRSGRADLPTRQGLEAMFEAEWVDLDRVWTRSVVTGAGHSVKTVAHSLGFSWPDDDAGGDNSMVRYAEAVSGDAAAVDWLRAYNEADVRATYVVRAWLREQFAQLPRIEDWAG